MATAAAMRKRYHEMVMAMENANMEPVIIEDLVRIGEDLGLERGLERGLQQGRIEGRLVHARAALRRVLDVRKLALTPEQDERIEACAELPTLDRWLDQAVLATTAAEALR